MRERNLDLVGETSCAKRKGIEPTRGRENPALAKGHRAQAVRRRDKSSPNGLEIACR